MDLRAGTLGLVGSLMMCGAMLAACASGKNALGDDEGLGGDSVSLGNFSVSLSVKDLEASRAFYEKLGFKPVAGDASKNWLIVQNDTATIGLYQGMFERNTLTFNPGWDRSSKPLPSFTDVRVLQQDLIRRGLSPTVKAEESGTGPAFLLLTDPDGNPVLVDQHVNAPEVSTNSKRSSDH